MLSHMLNSVSHHLETSSDEIENVAVKKMSERSDNKISSTAGLGKEIKIYQQDCQRMVTSIDNYPTLELDAPMDIQLTKGVSMFYRFALKGLPSPIKFEIIYNDVPAE